jgi:hypothetical protein
MSKISELGPITGANTRTEDLFVIVNLIQGDDGTKNITRAELVQALQYEIFDRITITGGLISGVTIFDSNGRNLLITESQFNTGTLDSNTLTNSNILTATANNITMTNSVITSSEFNNGTGNNDVFTFSRIDYSDFSNGTGNNNVFTNSRIDNSEYNNVTIEQGTANGLILTNISIDELILEDAFISNSEIITTSFANGSISNSTIINTDLDDVDITNSRFSNGQIWDTAVSNSTITATDFSNGTGNNNIFTNTTIDQGIIINSVANNIVITSSEFNDGTANNINIVNSDFSDGTGNNNVFTNTTIQDGTLDNNVITNSSFQGSMEDVVATNMTITSSTSQGMAISNKSSFVDGVIQDTELSNTTIEDSKLVDFDMELHKVWQPNMDEDSYFAIKNFKTGDTEQITYRQFFDEISKSTEKALKVHVAVDGDDNNPGTLLKPVKTLARASQLAIEKAGGVTDRNALNSAVHISVGPGTYYVDDPIVLPDDCSMTSTAGQYATVIEKKPGYERTNGVLVGSGCYVQGFAYMNFEVDNFDYPEGGFAVAYRPGALLRRSPYIRDSSQLSNFNRLDVEPPLNPFNSKGTIADLGQEFYMVAGHSTQANFAIDDEVTFSSGASGFISYIADIDSNSQIYVRNLKGNVEPGDMLYAESGGTATIDRLGIDDFPNRLVGRGGGCMLADRRVLDPDSLYTYVLCFGFTPRTQNGMGYVARDGAGVNGIGSLSIFVRTAFYALNGGQMTLNNSGTQFGDISMRAKGSTAVFTPAETSATLFSNTTFADIILDNKEEIVEDMVVYLTANTANGGLNYQGYDAAKCFRDTGIIVDSVGYDVALNTNYWGRLNGIAYESPISYVVKNEQQTETLGANQHLKSEINRLFANANTEVLTRANRSLDETLSILDNSESYASDIIWQDTGNVARTAARELIQDNRDLIINGMIDWIDNNDEFFSYDSKKCRRDMQEYILPAVKWDSLLDTNYNSNIAGQAYYFKQSATVADKQRNETVATFEKLRKVTDELVEANSALMAERSFDKFSTIIDILDNTRTTKFSPTKATYEPDTGRMVITIGNHTLQKGQFVTFAEEAFTFTCTSDNNVMEIKHPRRSDTKNFNKALPIEHVSAKTITVNAGTTGANFAHTFVSAKPKSVSVLGEVMTFSDSPLLDGDKKNARKQLQANKEYIQDYMEAWADNEWFFYDSDKCQRDTTQYIMPAVQRDLLLGTNFNALQTGIAYRTKSGEVSVTDQLEQTVGAVNFMKSSAATTAAGNSIAVDRLNDSFDEITGLLNNYGKKYTPTNATYNPQTGVTVLTLGDHDFDIGDHIYLEPFSLIFTCALDGNVTEHGYPATTFTDYTPTDASYDPASGVFTATIGTHNLQAGDKVEFKDGAVTFTCALDGNTTNHPAPESHHPFFRKQVEITSVTSTTITMNVGAATDGGGTHTFVSALADGIRAERQHPAYKKPIVISDRTATTITINVGESSDTSTHTFVRADTNAVREAADPWLGRYTPQNVIYDPVNGDMEIFIGSHTLPVGKWISIDPESITLSCANTSANTTVELTHPRRKEKPHDEPIRIHAVTATSITVNVGNANGYTEPHTFVSATKGCINAHAVKHTDAAKFVKAFTPTTSTYDPGTGIMNITIADHGLNQGDHIQIMPLGITFSCVNTATSDTVEISHPRLGEPLYEHPIEITAVTTNTITVNAGTAGGYGGTHTFVRADEGSVMQVSASEQGTYASRQIKKNKKFIQEEVKAYLNDNYFIYEDAKCRRDTGYILDAVRRDVATGSNLNAVMTGMAYRSGTVGSDVVINDQLTETVGSITWLKGEIASDVLTDATAISRSNAAFDEIIDIMQNGNANADTIDFGTYSISQEAFNARNALQENKAFIQAETIAWIKQKYPNFGYNVDACKRDLGYFIDTVSWDIQHGSTAATVNNTRLYFENGLSVLDDAEIVPTSESYKFIAGLVSRIINGIDCMEYQAVEAQVYGEYTYYTPSNATYDPVTGVMEVTIGTHGFAVGDRISIDPGGITFSCGFGGGGTDSHPNTNDPNYKGQFIITAISGTSITVNAGAANGYQGAHTFVSATADCIRPANMAEAYTPTNVVYDHVTGVMEMTLGERHSFVAGDYIIFDENAITLSCPTSPSDPTPINISHPRPTDPIYNKPVKVDSVTSTTVTLQVGEAKVDKVHTFVSATTNGVRRAVNPTIATKAYDLFDNIGLQIRNNNGAATRAEVEIEPTLTSDYNSTVIADAQGILGNKQKYQEDIIEFIRDNYNGLSYNISKCNRDVGYILDAIDEDIEYGGNAATINAANFYFEATTRGAGSLSDNSPISVNVLPEEQRAPTKAAFSHLADVVQLVVRGQTVTPTTGNTVDQNTSLTAADLATGNRAHDLIEIIAQGVDDYSSGKLPAVSGAPIMPPSRTFARKSLEKNRKWFQEEIVRFVDKEHFTFDENKCARDAGFILDAVRRDVQTGSTYNGKYVGKSYRIGTVGADKVIEEQLAETIEGIQYIQKDIEALLSGVALSRAQVSFNNIIRSMVDDYTPDGTNYDYGSGNQGGNYVNARNGLQINRNFIQAEATAWVNVNYPTLDYSEAKCQRDTGIMVDAVCYDIQHGSNTAMRDVAKLYFENGLSTLSADQRAPTAALYTHLGEICEDILNKVTITPSTGNGVAQDTGFGPVAAAIGIAQKDLWNIVEDVIAEDSLINMPDVREAQSTSLSAVAYDYDAEAQIIADRTPTIQANITDYLKTTFNFLEYDRERCFRDTGYIIDAVAHDIQYGGNSGTVNAAGLYFKNAVNVLPYDQRVSTRRAFTHLAKQVEKITRAEPVGYKLGNKWTPHAANYDPASGMLDMTLGGDFTPLNGDEQAKMSATSATYNPATGESVITVADASTISAGDLIILADNSLTFTCTQDGNATQHSYPRPTDPASGTPLRVSASDATTFTVNVGASDINSQYAHTFVSATADGITHYNNTSDYDSATGNLRINIGNHTLKIGDKIEIAPEGMTFSCDFDENNTTHAYPRKRVYTPKTGTTYDPTSGDMVLTLLDTEQFTPAAGTTYDPSNGKMVVEIGNHDLKVGEYVHFANNSLTFTCTQDSNVTQHTYPRPGSDRIVDSAVVISAVTATTFTVNVGPSPEGQQYAHTFVSATSNAVTKSHNLENGENVLLAPNSIRFTCALDSHATTHSYPQIGHPAYDTPVAITAHTPTTVTVNVGGYAGGTAHIFVGADDNAVSSTDPIYGKRTAITAVTDTSVTINVGASPTGYQHVHTFVSALAGAVATDQHNLKVGDYILIQPESMSFTCAQDNYATVHAYPQSHHPAYDTPVKILEASPTTVRVDVGKALPPNSGGVHRFVSATINAIGHVIGNPIKQDMTNLAARREIAAEAKALAMIIADISDDNSTDAIPLERPPLTTWIQDDIVASKEAIEDSIPTLVTNVINYITETWNGASYAKQKCRRDVGSIIDALSHDMNYNTNYATRIAAQLYFEWGASVLPFDQRQQSADFFKEMADVVENIVQELPLYEQGFTATDAFYDPVSGMFTATLGVGHGFEIGDYVNFEPSSFTFSCDNGSGPQNHSVPEPGHPYYNKPCQITMVTADKITMNVGDGAGYTGAHTFVSATEEGLKRAIRVPYTTQDTSGSAASAVEGEQVADLVRIIEDAIRRNSLDAVPRLVEPDTSWVDSSMRWAAKQIEMNKDELADEVIEFINSEFNTLDYDKAKCRRDTGYLVDAFSYDLNYGGNSASRWNAEFYFWNNIFRLPEDQRIPTAVSYRKLGEIARDVLLEKYPGTVIKGESTTEYEANRVADLANIYYRTFLNKDEKDLGPTILPDFTWEDNTEFKFARDILINNKKKLSTETVRYVGAQYKFFDINKTRRDAGNLLTALTNDFRFSNVVTQQDGSQTAMRTYAAAFFDYQGRHVFPVFNATTAGLSFQGTLENLTALSAITGQKPNHAYIVSTDYTGNRYAGDIYYWNGTTWVNDGANNTDLLYVFYKSWERMKNYIKNNYTPDTDHDDMIDGLFVDVLEASVLRPTTLNFGSLVESIAHQFNGASAGVNRNALPINFRNLGLPISAIASVLSEDGGRVRWSGADELNNQYFARGLRINGRTGRIEGRPFTSSVRKLARRASNSRAVV